jgi:RHS repeat-associated protein
MSGKTPILRDSTFDAETGAPTSAGRLYYTSDANTNVTGLVNASGQVVERYVYSAYGNVTFCDASWAPLTSGGNNSTTPGSSSAVGNGTLYASMVLDPATGLDQDEARWYDACTSVFVSMDPAMADRNLYRYCGNNPVAYVDPTGLWTKLKRDGGEYAHSCAQEGDTWASLAKLANMDPAEYEEWVGHQPVEDGKPEPGKTYEVPNTIYVDVGNVTWEISWFFVRARQKVSEYRNEGFEVDYNPEATKADMLLDFRQRDIYGFVAYGHGEEDGGGVYTYDFPGLKTVIAEKLDINNYILNARDVYVLHKIAILRLYSCCAGLQDWTGLLVPGGDYYAPKGDINAANPDHDQINDPPIHYEGPTGGNTTPCFRSGTLIHTETRLREIESVSEGTRLWAFDHERQLWRLMRVVATEAHDYVGPIVTMHAGDDIIEATPAHPFWVTAGDSLEARPVGKIPETAAQPSTGKGRWVAAQDLRHGDVLLAHDSRLVKIKSTETKEKTSRVFNLRVEGHQNYAVGIAGLLVHNM